MPATTRPEPLMRHHRPHLVDRASTPRGIRPPEPIPVAHSVSAEGLAALLGLTPLVGNTTVNETTVSGLAAVEAGVDMVAHAVAAMMSEAQAFDADGNEIEVPSIVARPTPLYGSFEFYYMLVHVLMKHGNAPGILADFDDAGYGRQVVPAHPSVVSLDDSSGLPLYKINGADYDWSEVVHVRHGAVWGALWGCGIVEKYRNALQRQLAEQEYGRTSMMSGGIPSAHVQLDKATATDDEAEAIDTRWNERFGSGVRKPLVSGKAISITPLSWSPEDADWVEARKMSVGEAALVCGLHPSDLGASLGGDLDYANLTDRQLSRVVQSFMPWMRLIEEAWSDLLPGRSYVRGRVEALLRTSMQERFEIYKLGQELGIYTGPELRELERRPQLDETEEHEDPDTDPTDTDPIEEDPES